MTRQAIIQPGADSGRVPETLKARRAPTDGDEVFQPLTAAIISPSHEATGPDPFLVGNGSATISAIWRVVHAAEFDNEDTAVTPPHERRGEDRTTESSQPTAM